MSAATATAEAPLTDGCCPMGPPEPYPPAEKPPKRVGKPGPRMMMFEEEKLYAVIAYACDAAPTPKTEVPIAIRFAGVIYRPGTHSEPRPLPTNFKSQSHELRASLRTEALYRFQRFPRSGFIYPAEFAKKVQAYEERKQEHLRLHPKKAWKATEPKFSVWFRDQVRRLIRGEGGCNASRQEQRGGPPKRASPSWGNAPTPPRRPLAEDDSQGWGNAPTSQTAW